MDHDLARYQGALLARRHHYRCASTEARDGPLCQLHRRLVWLNTASTHGGGTEVGVVAASRTHYAAARGAPLHAELSPAVRQAAHRHGARVQGKRRRQQCHVGIVVAQARVAVPVWRGRGRGSEVAAGAREGRIQRSINGRHSRAATWHMAAGSAGAYPRVQGQGRLAAQPAESRRPRS